MRLITYDLDYAADDNFDRLLALSVRHNIYVQLVANYGPGAGWPTVRLAATDRASLHAAIVDGWDLTTLLDITADEDTSSPSTNQDETIRVVSADGTVSYY